MYSSSHSPRSPASPRWQLVTGHCPGPLVWENCLWRSLCVLRRGIMACIHRCRNATRSTVHESGATPSLTTSRHLRSTPQISLCLVCTYIQSTHPRAQASLSNGILQTNIPTYMYTYMHTYITQRWCALAAGLRRNTGYNSLSVCCTARHESSEQEQL
jgi:hypothetical protein